MLQTVNKWLIPTAVVALACVAYRAVCVQWPPAAVPAPSAAAQSRPHGPLKTTPRYDLKQAVSDEQLAGVLRRMIPRREPVNTNNLVHALRMWGPVVEFDHTDAVSGGQMLAYFLDDHAFRSLAGENALPLYVRTERGVEIRSYDADDRHAATGSVHPDDLLATLAECGVTVDTPLVLRDGQATVGQLLDTSLGRFHEHQFEYEWSLISYARYVFPQPRFRNRFGQTLAVKQILDELIEHPARHGVCAGTHRLEALVVLDQAHEQTPGLTAAQVKRIHQHLQETSATLAQSQHLTGYWTKRWPEGIEGAADDKAPLAERILATGHHLEWMALAPPELLPPRECIVRAAQWLTRAMLEVDDATVALEYGPFSHGARALCLWRGCEPQAVWQSIAPDAVAPSLAQAR